MKKKPEQRVEKSRLAFPRAATVVERGNTAGARKGGARRHGNIWSTCFSDIVGTPNSRPGADLKIRRHISGQISRFHQEPPNPPLELSGPRRGAPSASSKTEARGRRGVVPDFEHPPRRPPPASAGPRRRAGGSASVVGRAGRVKTERS